MTYKKKQQVSVVRLAYAINKECNGHFSFHL